MRLSEILRSDCVKVPLTAQAKQDAISELIDLLCDRTDIGASRELMQAVWQREQTRTTGIGHGVAIPHGKSADCDKLCMAVAKPAAPIEFGSIDGRPVDLIFLLISPLDQTGPHIQALATISRMLTDETLRAALKRSSSAQEMYDLILSHEAQMTN